MTERLLTGLQDRAGRTEGKRAYLDMWKMLRRQGYRVALTSSVDFPKVRRNKEHACILQDTLNVIVERDRDDTMRNIDDYRTGKPERVFGGMSSHELMLVLRLQATKKRVPQSELSRFVSNARFAIPIALLAQLVDINESTPSMLQGHIKDGVAVPVINSLLPRLFRDSRANVALTTFALYAWEFSQKFLYSSHTTFDVWDLAAYSAGAAGILTYEELKRRMSSNKPVLDAANLSS